MLQKISPIYLTVLLLLIFGLFLGWDSTFNRRISEFESQIFYQLRGSRPVSDSVFVIYIGDNDVQALNGWPMTRDYYSYAIHALNTLGARTIAIDILFSGQDIRYSKYDQTLLDFISAAGNVCLPMVFSELKQDSVDDGIMLGINPLYSFDPLPHIAAASGFSNFPAVPVIHRTPLLARSGPDTLQFFGYAAYQAFRRHATTTNTQNNIPGSKTTQLVQPRHNELWINYFGNIDNVPAMSFVELLQKFRRNPEEIDLRNKLVLVIVTASGVAQFKTTPLGEPVPASLIHLSVIDTLIQKNWLRLPGIVISWLVLSLWALFFYTVWRLKNTAYRYTFWMLIAVGYSAVSVYLFSAFHTVLPLIYPIVLGLALIIGLESLTRMQARFELTMHSHQLKMLLKAKEAAVEDSRRELAILQDKLTSESDRSDISKQQINEQQTRIAQLEKQLSDLRSYSLAPTEKKSLTVDQIIYAKTSALVPVIDLIKKISADDIAVLITGETGTGKELIAREIHNHSRRRDESFIAVNCGALSEALLESELFGHIKGSFTGAVSDRKGRFQLANGGTIFLDEITETSLAFQSKLLRVLQEGIIEPVGSDTSRKVDVRIIAASNKNIEETMRKEEFRADLFYRLNGFMLQVPPLRERGDDILLLAHHFIKKYNYKDIEGISERAVQLLQNYYWPGNIRELENVIRRAAILAKEERRYRALIQESDLPAEIRTFTQTEIDHDEHVPIEEQILNLLRKFKFSRSSITQTAKILGNRDRGTITEYFKGICFEALVKSHYDLQLATSSIANSSDQDVIKTVQNKIQDYLKNLENYHNTDLSSFKTESEQPPPFKGLPKKYHTYLEKVLQNLNQIH